MLLSRKLDPAEHDRLLRVVIRNAKRLQHIRRYKDRKQSFKLNKEKININDVIVDVIEDYRDQIVKSNNQNKLAYEPIVYENNNKEDIIVKADRERVTQVISNLLSNAVKFTKDIKGAEDRVIRIDAKKVKKYYRDYLKDLLQSPSQELN